MRRFGIGLILVGAFAYYLCGQQRAAAAPVPAGLSIEASLGYPAGRYEIGQYVAAMLAGAGLLLALFPQGAVTPRLRSVCVFCGSSRGNDPAFAAAAVELGTRLAAEGRTLVYGGGGVGLMGLLADAALAGGARVIGVIPEALAAREVAHRGLTELRVVPSMHARKALMADLADAFVALPGGFGTLDELFEIVTWAQLGLHARPIGLLDVNDYYGPLLAFADRAVAEAFVRPEHRRLLVVEKSVEKLLAALDAAPPAPDVPKWT